MLPDPPVSSYSSRASEAGPRRRPRRNYPDHPYLAPHRQSENVSDPESGVGLVGRLAIDAHRSLAHQAGAVAARPHEAGAPEPFVQPLPIAVLVLTHPYAEPRYDAPARSRSEASAANGPDWAARGVAAALQA